MNHNQNESWNLYRYLAMLNIYSKLQKLALDANIKIKEGTQGYLISQMVGYLITECT